MLPHTCICDFVTSSTRTCVSLCDDNCYSGKQAYVVSLFNQGDHMGKYHAEEALPRIRLGFLKMNERSKKNISQQLAKIDRSVKVMSEYKLASYTSFTVVIFRRERMTQYSYKMGTYVCSGSA